MAQYKGTIQSNRGTASRLGGKQSGLVAACNGWNIGITSIIDYNDAKERDEIEVWLTPGSNKNQHTLCLGKFYRDADGAFIRITKSEL